ncbi:hypothetical protein [Ectobacillus polymachus]|uniref:hypothetical protein n=1 Tax=Ectobacillus polymachus TaxID=1508806 RepID=UPI003A853D89
MKDTTKYVGLDVSKEKISVAIADEGRNEPKYLGMIYHTPEALRKLIKKLGAVEQLKVYYEVGPTGYEIYRLLLSLGVDCTVIAPSLIPQKPEVGVLLPLNSGIKKKERITPPLLFALY